jgi:hypothetical protein
MKPDKARIIQLSTYWPDKGNTRERLAITRAVWAASATNYKRLARAYARVGLLPVGRN